jgi:hypothetical protein
LTYLGSLGYRKTSLLIVAMPKEPGQVEEIVSAVDVFALKFGRCECSLRFKNENYKKI